MKVGLSKEEIEKLLNSDDFSKEVREDEEKGYLEGVHGVPYFIINGDKVINGAASKQVMKETLLNVLNKENESKKDNGHPEGVVCDETGCYFKKK